MSSDSLILHRAFEQARQQAQSVENHGKAVEKLAHSLDGQLLTTEQAEAMEQVGQQLRQHAQRMAVLAEMSLHNESCLAEEYALVHQHQCQVVLLYVKAMRVLLQATQSLL
ncbi:hypothetical protein IQ268_28790 [Oculatella sp. LEGE 06141]|uniref:hypothetical protein n=1 Tax=Oculatella sp. LEGE 06141 TaxID=1828648 RepID=UPI001881F14F|nr:hypothetical protein [Oculatella sp. LEGE 06141]MBE9182552.1 hypothetical protein [Oculatella sp. LEGE 06141]